MLNFTVVQGRMVSDPELRYTQTQTPVCSFRVAWSEKIKDNENRLFLSCIAWQGTAEFISRYWRKGQEIIVNGKLNTRQWQDKDGNNRTVTELTVRDVNFCGPKEKTGQEMHVPISQDFESLAEDSEEVPF